MSLGKIRKLRDVVTCNSKTLAVLLWETGYENIRISQCCEDMSVFEMNRLGQAMIMFADEVEEAAK